MRFMNFVKPLSRLLRPDPKSAPKVENRAPAPPSESPESLVAVALASGETLPRVAAQRRLAHLIDTGTIEFATLCVPTGNVSALLSVAAFCSNPDPLNQAFALVDDPSLRVKLVSEGTSSRIRQRAAQSIQDPLELKQLLKQVRGKDNGVYKIIKEKCDLLRAEELRRSQADQAARAACAALERHGQRLYDALYEPALRIHEAQWRDLAPLTAADVREHAQQAIDRCRLIVDEHARQVADQAAAALQQAVQRSARDESRAQAAADTQRQSEESALAAAEAARLREAEMSARAEQRAMEALAVRQLGGLISKAHGALRDGTTGRAAGMRRAVAEKLATMPAPPPYLASQIQQLDEKLQELKQWKDYAVAPKRAELIEEMEALVGSSEEPKALAARIKELQDGWKTISAGIVSDSEADWQRFHQAAQTAYQPCREYFEAQTQRREANATKRRELLQRFAAFATAQSGDQPDWRAVTAVLQEARQEWRTYFPVDRAAAATLQHEFDTAVGQLQGRLDAWHASNAAEKKSLIERAQQLRAKDDSRDALDAMKLLQLQWKRVGAAAREQEQPLWNAFREQCDAVYQKRKQAYADYTAGLEANKARAVELCEAAEKAAAATAAELLEAAQNIPHWRETFESLGEMPRVNERALHDRFERAIAGCRTHLKDLRAHEAEQSFSHLFEAARHIHAYGWAVSQAAAASDREHLKQAAETYIAGIDRWPKAAMPALQAAWDQAAAAATADTAGTERRLRMLCIRCEVLVDLQTPPEDQALRRELQVQRLMQHMGQHQSTANAEDLDALALEWVQIGPLPMPIFDPLLARFRRCRIKT